MAVPAAADAYIKAVCFTATVGTDEKGVEPDNRLAQVTRGGTITIGGGLGTPGMETPTGLPVSMAAPDYDGNGNLTADDTFTYAYDPLNRLVAVRVKSTTLLVAQYYYDAAGERTGVKAYNAGGTAATFMQTLRNGSDALYEKTWDLSGGTVNTEKVYLMAGGRMAVTRQKAYGLTTTYTYYGTDHLGTVRSTVVLNSAGQAQPTTFHDYEPFGVEIPGDTVYASANTHRYTGQERDGLYNPATGATDYLDYMHFRSTAVNLGRFMRPDNVNGNMGNPQSWNLYSYVHGNPVNLNDPTGHAAGDPNQQVIKPATAGGTPTPQKMDEKRKREEMWLAYEKLKQMGNLSKDTLAQAAKQLLSVFSIGNNPVSKALGGQTVRVVQNGTGAWEGQEGAKGAVNLLKATGTAIAIKGFVTSSTAVVQAETATQAAIAAAGGTAEAVSAGFLGSGLTAGTGLGLAGASFVAGVSVGNAARENLIPESANETYGDVLQTATDFYGASNWIANMADSVDRILP